jgi:membrane peptidoglycan carboxypeptidase
MNVQALFDSQRERPDAPNGATTDEAPTGTAPLDLGPPIVVRSPRRGLPDDAHVGIDLGFEDPVQGAIRSNPRRARRPVSDRVLTGLLVVVALGLIVAHELRYSTGQAVWLAGLASRSSFELAPGPNPVPLAPDTGPFDARMGYAALPVRLERLAAEGFQIHSQARPSAGMRALNDHGLDLIYSEKSQAGLTLLDRAGEPLHTARYPQFVYESFESIPRLVVASLLFIEDRELLDDSRPTHNPVFDWERLSKAGGLSLLRYLGRDDAVIGASTLATQAEKFRHSAGGRTENFREKYRQMASASVRMYRYGADNRVARRQLVADYLNALPLAGRAAHGEIIGLGDGLAAWYGADFVAENRALAGAETDPEGAGLAFKQALSLIVAARRPTYYLGQSPAALAALTDSYLRVMAKAGVISPALRDAALEQPLVLAERNHTRPFATPDFATLKGVNLARTRLASLLAVDDLYQLDRLDMTAGTTIDAPVQSAVNGTLASLRDRVSAQRLGLIGDRLLGAGDLTKVIYSFTLYERSPNGNLVRVNTDSLDEPFDINTGARIDLGSTAKLRTLITYLELVGQAYGRFVTQTPQQLSATVVHPKDRLSAWVIEQLREQPGAALSSVLSAAMQRRYSASPYQAFLTGGGSQTFSNFNRADNARVLTVQQALQQSVNLVFVRLMREMTDHLTYRAPGFAAAVLENSDHPDRELLLQRFADREGRQFIERFYRKYHGRRGDDALNLLLDGAHATPRQLATIFRSVRPDAPVGAFVSLVEARLPAPAPQPDDILQLYEKYSPERFSLRDRGYLARVHPLELWVLAYLEQHPDASLAQVQTDSASARQDVYRWLFKTSRHARQDRRIQQLLEMDAFLTIHDAWQRLGYPFASITPSLATALGSSGDRPGALAELMGVIANDGLRQPTVLIDDLQIASNTPYETRLVRGPVHGERVLAPEIARVVRDALVKVVDEGTAIALRNRLASAGYNHVVGGKTGTGDHRYKVFAGPGRLIESTAINRAATFVFLIDDRFFGTITAFVPGTDAANYQFTSSLPVRVLGALLPELEPLLSRPAAQACGPEQDCALLAHL